jgi:hypothetical protein
VPATFCIVIGLSFSSAFACASKAPGLTITMLARLLTIGFLSLGLGCGRTPPSSGAETEPEPSAVDAAAQPSGGERLSGAGLEDANAEQARIAATLAELTQVVRKYSVEQRRAPKALEELVADGYLSQIPPAPSGKRFAINQNLQVYLADE